MPYSTKPLLDAHEERLASQIKSWLGQPKDIRWRILYKVQPSTFIDPDLVDSQQLKTVVYEGLIAFAIVERKIKGRVVAAVVDERLKSAQIVKTLLESFNIKNCVCDLQADREAIKDFILNSIASKAHRWGNIRDRKVSNKYEEWMVKNLEAYLSGLRERQDQALLQDAVENVDRIFSFQEPCLSEFIQLPPKAPVEHLEFAKKSRVDFLLTSGPPSFNPVLVLEMDGPHHDTPGGKRRDALKEAILTEAGVSIFRIRVQDIPYEIHHEKGNLDQPKHKILTGLNTFYENLFINIVVPVMWGSHYEKVERPRIWENYQREWASKFQSNVEAKKKANNKTALTSGQIDEILKSVYEDRHLQEIEADSIDAEYATQPNWREIFSFGGELIRFTGSKLGNIRRKNTDSYAIVTAKLSIPNGKIFPINVPCISLRLIGKIVRGYDIPYDDIAWSATEQLVRIVADQILKQEQIPLLITQKQFDDWMRYWSRPWKKLELELLGELFQNKAKLAVMAKALDRSQYHVKLKLQRELLVPIRKEGSDLDSLREGLLQEAIQLTQEGRIPKKLRLVHSS